MQIITRMIDGSTSLNASEFNQIPDETENIILSTGQTLSAADLFQLSKSVAIYAARGDVYTDIGSVNNIRLNPVGLMKYPTSYTQGMRVRFKPAWSNTSATVVMRVGTLADVGLSQTRIPNGGSPIVTFSSMETDKWYTAVYTTTPDTLTDYWLIDNAVNTDNIVNGAISGTKLESDCISTSKIVDGAVTSAKILDGTITSADIQDGTISNVDIATSTITNDRMAANQSLSKISQGTLDITDGASRIQMSATTGVVTGPSTSPNASYRRPGVLFGGTNSPGTVVPYFRTATYDILSYITLVGNLNTKTDSGHNHQVGTYYSFAGTGFDTGIAWSSRVLGATVSYETAGLRKMDNVPVILESESVSGNRYIQNMYITSEYNEIAASPNFSGEFLLQIFMDGTSL